MIHSRTTTAASAMTVLLFATACGGAGDADAEAAPTVETSTGQPAAAGLVNANLATRDDLSAVPGLSAPAVDAILAGRPFLTMAALHRTLSDHVAADDDLYARLWVPIDLNSATAEEILLIPGVGDRMLHEFEEYRPYVAMAQFRREMAKYVDDEEVDRLARYVFVQIDLNTASDEDILAIPGVGERMLHEFKEYRPYTSMEQFRREIGKYVDDAELARLARYVRLN